MIYLARHLLILCPISPQPLHFGGARVRGCKAGEGLLRRGEGGASIASTGLTINWEASYTERPPSASICFLDLARFCFCFSLAARNSLFSLASKIAPCIVRRKPFTSWFNAQSDGLGGLRDLIQSKALIDEAWRRSSFSVKGVFRVKFRLNSLPRLARGVRVRSRILSFEITLSGLKGTKPVAKKLFLIVSDLKASIRARGYTLRKSSLSIWLIPFRILVSTIRPYNRFNTAKQPISRGCKR